jgi:hypothetical protein
MSISNILIDGKRTRGTMEPKSDNPDIGTETHGKEVEAILSEGFGGYYPDGGTVIAPGGGTGG